MFSNFVSGLKNAIYFEVRQSKVAKIAFEKLISSVLPVVFGHCTIKNKDIGFRMFMWVSGIELYRIYLCFLDKFDTLDLLPFIFEKSKF